MSGRIVLKGPFGFVGSAFRRALEASDRVFEVVSHENRSDFPSGEVDLFLDCAGNSRKYLAESNPDLDRRQNVEEVEENLKRYRPARYVLLSSSAVYADTSSAAATQEVEEPAGEVSVYGAHKREAEQRVRTAGGQWLILRPAGFFGPGLAKGPVYDLLEGLPPCVSPASTMQLLDVDAFAAKALRLADQGGTFNAVPRDAVRLEDVFPDEAAAQRRVGIDADLPRLDFAVEGRRFSEAIGPGPSGYEALREFAAVYGRWEARRSVEVLVLAGGLGTRLPGPAPKAIRPVAGKALILRVAQPFLDAGYSGFTFLLGNGADQVASVLDRAPALSGAKRMVEDSPLGTGGAVLHALEKAGCETAMVVNGDTLFRGLDVEALVKRHVRTGAVATLAGARVEAAARFGALRVTDDGRLEAFEEKVAASPGWVYAGCMVVDARGFLEMAGSVRRCSLERDLLPGLAASGHVHVRLDERLGFVDAGTPEGFQEAERFVKEDPPCSS